MSMEEKQNFQTYQDFNQSKLKPNSEDEIAAAITYTRFESLKRPLKKSAVPTTIPVAVVKHARDTKMARKEVPKFPKDLTAKALNSCVLLISDENSMLYFAPKEIKPT